MAKENFKKIADLCKALCDELNIVLEEVKEKTEKVAPKPKAEEIKIEDVRHELAEASRQGKTAEVRELLKKHGAAKLSEIDPKEYAALLKEAKELKSAS